MWFRFPPGAESITVELQNFGTEWSALDADGKEQKFFRAPDHFAPTILALPGFGSVPQPDGAPDDLAPTLGAQASAFELASAQLSSAKDENESLRNQLAEAAGMLKDYQQKLMDAHKRIAELEAASDSGEGKKSK
jgi:hypothetical protein